MKHAVGIHCQFMNDNEALWNYLISFNKPFSVFLVPELLVNDMRTESGELIYDNIHSAKNHYPGWAKKCFIDNKDNLNITWIQEGYRHCCEKDFLRNLLNELKGKGKQPDPHHEHICVSDDSTQSLFKQKGIIHSGMNMIEAELGIVVEGYCSPNHLGNDDTLNAVQQLEFDFYIAKNGFNYIPVFGKFIGLPAYRDEKYKDLIVVPESIIGKGKKSPLIGAYYNRLGNRQSLDKILESLDSAVPILDLKPIQKRHKTNLSEFLVYNYKKFRDLKTKVKALTK